MDYSSRYDEILTSIENIRVRVNQHQIIKIVAASKSADVSMIEAMYNIGQRAFGENRIQDMGDKVNALYDPNDPMLSIQQDARFQGQLDAYTLLLAYHEEVTTEHDTAIKVNLNPEEM